MHCNATVLMLQDARATLAKLLEEISASQRLGNALRVQAASVEQACTGCDEVDAHAVHALAARLKCESELNDSDAAAMHGSLSTAMSQVEAAQAQLQEVLDKQQQCQAHTELLKACCASAQKALPAAAACAEQLDRIKSLREQVLGSLMIMHHGSATT